MIHYPVRVNCVVFRCRPLGKGYGRILLAALAAMVLSAAAPSAAHAQPVAGKQGIATKRTRTWDDAVALNKTLPPRPPRKEGAPSPNDPPPPAVKVIPLRTGARPEDTDPIARNPEPPRGPIDGPCGPFIGSAVGVQFEALADNATSFPPDTMGAVGPRHAMTMLNTQVRIQDRAGITDFSTVSLGAFWPDLTNAFDPKIFYDHRSQRWIAVCVGSASSAASNWSIAASLTDDPTGGWGWITLDADAGDTRWADYPCVGFNDKWIVVTFNMFAVPGAPMPGPTGPKIWVIDKAEMLGGGPTVTNFEIDVGFVAAGDSLQPAVNLDAGTPDVLMVDSGVYTDPVDGFPLIRLSRITGPTASPSWEAIPGSTYTLPGHFKAPYRFTMERRTAPQSGAATPVEVGNARACNAVFRDGSLYFCHSGGGFFGGLPTNETLSFWYQLQPTLPSPVVNWGFIGEGVGTAVFYPSIAVNCRGDIGIGYSRTSAAINIATGFAFIPAGATGAAPYDLAAGGSGYVRLDMEGRNRWGDFSATVVDPRDDMSFWTIQESASATANRWTTRWSQFPHDCSGALVIHSQPADASFCPGANLTLSLNASGTGNSYQWFRDNTQIPGALGPTLLIPDVTTAGHTGIYHAIVTNNCGVTRSADATVRVGITIASHPQDRVPSPCESTMFSVGVAFPVGTLQYRWHKEFAPLGINIPLDDDGHFSGVHTPTLTIVGANFADEGRYTCLVSDPACANVELFSGYGRLTMADPRWAHRTSSGPVRRVPFYTDMAYDESRGVCVLYGGSVWTSATNSTWGNDTWEWDGVEWTQRFPANNPGPRIGHEMVYDSVRNKILLIGGAFAGGSDAAVWQYDGTDWTLLTTSTGGPSFNNSNHGDAAFDRARGKVVFLTFAPGATYPANQTWEFDPATLAWQMTYAGTSIEYVSSPLAFDPVSNSVVASSVLPFSNITVPWRYDGTGWQQLNTLGPFRYSPVLAADAFRNRVTLFGNARNELNYLNFHNSTFALIDNFWSLILPEFQPVAADRLWPAAMCFDTRRNAMVVVGNTFNNYTGLNPMDTWEYRYLDKVVFDRQPQNQDLIIGATAQFKVAAAGAGTLTYQWRKGTTPLINGPTAGGSTISGAQSGILTITNTVAADAGSYSCLVSNACGSLASDAANLGTVCYSNCDGSTVPPVLNVSDFICFQTRYAAGDPYANCDGSTIPPVLNVSDFICFQSGYAAGCP